MEVERLLLRQRHWRGNIQMDLILYGPCIILQYICNPTKYTTFYDWVYSHLVARHVSDLNVHSHERLQAVCCRFGMCWNINLVCMSVGYVMSVSLWIRCIMKLWGMSICVWLCGVLPLNCLKYIIVKTVNISIIKNKQLNISKIKIIHKISYHIISKTFHIYIIKIIEDI